MLTIAESRLLRVLIALRDATGAKTRTPVAESAVAGILRGDPDFGGSVSDELDDLERQGFAQISRGADGAREVQMTAPGKIKAEEIDRLTARGTLPATSPGVRSAPRTAAPSPALPDWRGITGEILDAAAQATVQLPADATPVVRILLEEARRGLADGSRPRVRRALAALAAYLGDSASGALANVLAAQIVSLAPQLVD
jgi:hypothetical protein